MEKLSEIPKVNVGTRKEWRTWLEKNHKKENKVYLISYKKHTGKPSINHREQMEIAICFGWIDTTLKRLDEDKYCRCFMKRTNNSRWSNNTLKYAEDMIKKGEMTEEGLKKYKEGLKKPVIDHGVGKNPEVPEILKKAFSKNKKAKSFFDKLPPSSRRMFIIQVMTAKMLETKQRRVDKIIKMCEENRKM